ncbi:MAG: hypothetical protein R2701_10485 [Acidimicrobiales bacterium]
MVVLVGTSVVVLVGTSVVVLVGTSVVVVLVGASVVVVVVGTVVVVVGTCAGSTAARTHIRVFAAVQLQYRPRIHARAL